MANERDNLGDSDRGRFRRSVRIDFGNTPPEPYTPIHPYLDQLATMSKSEQMDWAAKFEKENPELAEEFVRLITPWLIAMSFRGIDRDK